MKHFIEQNNQLFATFLLVDFKQALGFINKVGEVAESQNHHPEIINIYKKVWPILIKFHLIFLLATKI